MASEVDRKAVLKVTKVRKNLKQDGSWIHRSQVDQEPQDVQQTRKSLVPVNLFLEEGSPDSPAPQSPASTSPAPTSSDSSTTHRRSYIHVAVQKFESLGSTENAPVKSTTYQVKSPRPFLEVSDSPAEVTHKTPEVTPVEKKVDTLVVTSVDKAVKTSSDAPLEEQLETSKVTSVEKTVVVSEDTPADEALEIYNGTHGEKTVELCAGAPVEDTLDTCKVTPVEKTVETSATKALETVLVPSVRETVKTSSDILVKQEMEVTPVEEALETHVDSPVEKAVEIHADTPVEEALEKPKPNVTQKTDEVLETSKVTLVEKSVEIPGNTPVEEELKTSNSTPVENVEIPVDAPVQKVLETSKVTPVEKASPTFGDSCVDELYLTYKVTSTEKAVDTPVEKALEMSNVIPVNKVFETSKVTPVEEALETSNVTHEAFETTKVTPVEESLKTFSVPSEHDTVKTEETSKVTHAEKTFKIPAKSPALETFKVTPVEKAVEIPTHSLVEAEVETCLVTCVHESLNSPPKEALETSGNTTDNGRTNTADLVTSEIVHEVETTPEPKHEENQPTDAAGEYGELSLQSALEAPGIQSSGTSETGQPPAIVKLLTKTTEESSFGTKHHGLNSETRLSVKRKPVCSFCKQTIDGNVKITIDDPAVCCHPECFKCDGCKKPLGDLLYSMYHHYGKVLCERCFDDVFFL